MKTSIKTIAAVVALMATSVFADFSNKDYESTWITISKNSIVIESKAITSSDKESFPNVSVSLAGKTLYVVPKGTREVREFTLESTFSDENGMNFVFSDGVDKVVTSPSQNIAKMQVTTDDGVQLEALYQASKDLNNAKSEQKANADRDRNNAKRARIVARNTELCQEAKDKRDTAQSGALVNIFVFALTGGSGSNQNSFDNNLGSSSHYQNYLDNNNCSRYIDI